MIFEIVCMGYHGYTSGYTGGASELATSPALPSKPTPDLIISAF